MCGSVKAASPIKIVLIKDSEKEKLLFKYIIAIHPPTQVMMVKTAVVVKTNFLFSKYLFVFFNIA